MITIGVNNSYSIINGLTSAQHKALASTLSYTIGDRFSRFGPSKKTLLSKHGEFPTGLLNRVADHLCKDLKLEIRILNKRVKPPLPPGAPYLAVHVPKPYPAQVSAVAAAVSAGRGIISMPTGTGKSRVIEMIAASLGVKTLVIVPSLEIKKQLKESSDSFNNITVENIDSKALQTSKVAYDCLIIDEAHHVAAKTYQKLNKTAWSGIYYRFFLTATPFRNNKDETLLFESIAGSLIYQLTYKQSIAEKYIVPIEAYFYEIPKSKPEGYTWAQVYSELVVNNDTRNEMLCITLLRLSALELPTLCLVKEVKHGQLLSEMSGIPFVSGQDEDSRDYIRQFNRGDIKTLIGTVGVLGEGVDTKPCEYVLIAGLGKAKSQFMQAVGRAVRKYPGKESAKVILFKDRSHKWTLKHFNMQKKILLEEYGVETVKLDI